LVGAVFEDETAGKVLGRGLKAKGQDSGECHREQRDSTEHRLM